MASRTSTSISIPRRSRIATRAGLIEWFLARNLHIACFGVLVFLISLSRNVDNIPSTPFHPDESRWLNRAFYVRELLHPFGGTWEDRYLTRGQPPVGSYITGIGLLLQGRDLNTNAPWNFNYGNETTITWNVSRGAMPSHDDLVAARRTSAVAGAITCVAIFFIVTILTNWMGGLVGGLFMAIHPLQLYLSSLATADASFTCLVALATLVAVLVARKPTWPRAIGLGLLIGAGAGTKLSPFFVAVGLAIVGGLLVIDPILTRLPAIRRLIRLVPGTGSAEAIRLGWMLVSLPVTAAGFFLLTYPYLWPAPVERTRHLFAFRRQEMESQARIWTITSIDSRGEAVHRTWTNLENQYSSTGKLFARLASIAGHHLSERGVDVPIAMIGLALLAGMALRYGVTSPHFIVTMTLGAQGAVILGGLRVDFNRYYLPIVFIFAVGVGVLAGLLWSTALALFRSRRTDPTPPFTAGAAATTL